MAGGSLLTVERARDFARGFLAAYVPQGGDEVESVLLVVSELVSNAVRHAGGLTGIELEARPGTVRITVEDASPTPPAARTAENGLPGFGWLMVQELSEDVQVTVGPAGKAVTALVPVQMGTPRD